ncbi:MAG: anti-sigma factor family protein [Gammaproteobacteria bacterium]
MEITHAKVTELLPWYVNGTLAGEERAELDVHLRDCLVCRTALQEEQRMQNLIQNQEDIPLTADHKIGDLLSRIEAIESRTRRSMSGPRLALAASLAGIVVVSSILFFTLRTPVASNETGFSTLTDAPITNLDRVDIVFTEDVDSDEVLVILEGFGGRVVSGPSDLGRYTVAISEDSGFTLQEVIDQLTDDPRIRFAGQNFIFSPPVEER